MQYYILKEACDTKETGSVYPQIQKWKPGYNEDKSDSYYSYKKASYQESTGYIFPDFEPDLDSMIMHGRSKPTDLVSSFVSNGFIVSEKLKTLFEKFNLPAHRFLLAKVIHKKVVLDTYYFMHIISDYTDFVDYSKSTFITSGFFDSDPQPLNLISKQDFSNKSHQLQIDFNRDKENYRSIKSQKLYLNTQFDKSFDLFEIGRFDFNFYISQPLRNAIVENNITGCSINESNKLIISA